MKYTQDGGVIPKGVPVSQRRENEHMTLFGLFRGIIIKTVYPDDPKNTNGARIEYVVKVKGQEYPNAVSIKDLGGIYNYEETILKDTEKSFTSKLDPSVYDENVDGNVVYVMFLEGHGNVPIIIGSAEHSRKSKYKAVGKSKGRFSTKEFNGVEFSVDKDSNYTITQVGRKDKDGTVVNKTAIGDGASPTFTSSSKISQIKMDGKDGSVSITSSKGHKFKLDNKNGTENISLVTKGSHSILMSDAPGSETIIIRHKANALITLDSLGGVKVSDKKGNIIDLDAANEELKVIHSSGHILGMTADEVNLMHKSGKNGITLSEAATQIISDELSLSSSNAFNMESGSVAFQASSAPGVPGGKLSLAGTGFVALGNATSGIELLELFNQMLTALQTLTTAMALETHTGNLGFPTAPPLNAAAYAAVQAQLASIQALLLTIKGTL